MKIKKNVIYCCLIGLLLIATQAFGDDYNQYVIDLDKIHNEEIKQDNIISAARSVITRAKENKTQTAATLATISCAPPLPTEDLVWKLYHHVRDNYEWYFHTLGCDEDKLKKICREHASKSLQELEERLHKLEHVHKHASKHKPFMFNFYGYFEVERVLLNISLQNILVKESYKKCQEMRTILKQIDAEIMGATTDKDTAKGKKQQLIQEFTEKQQKLDQIIQQRKILAAEAVAEQRRLDEEKADAAEAIAKQKKLDEEKAAEVEQERAERTKQEAARAAYRQKYDTTIKTLGWDQPDKEAELEQAFKNEINLDEVAAEYIKEAKIIEQTRIVEERIKQEENDAKSDIANEAGDSNRLYNIIL